MNINDDQLKNFVNLYSTIIIICDYNIFYCVPLSISFILFLNCIEHALITVLGNHATCVQL